MRKLAYLNKPELPVMLVGAIVATLHGITLPVFGLLLSTTRIFYEPLDELKKIPSIGHWCMQA